MKNKSSFRFIAWLLALIMILNVTPLSALAEVTNNTRISNQDPSPALDSEDGYSVVGSLSTGTPPSENYGSFTVYYVIKGDYTYGGNNLLVKTETASNSQPSGYGGTAPDGCEFDNSSPKTWDAGTNSLTIYCKPKTCEVELRYMAIVDKDNVRQALTFQIFQNKESGLAQGERVEFKEFLREKTGGDTDFIKLKTYQNKDLNQLQAITVPAYYLTFNDPVYSSEGRLFKLAFYGYNYGSEVGTNISGITTGTTQIPWHYDQGKINLYFQVQSIDEE